MAPSEPTPEGIKREQSFDDACEFVFDLFEDQTGLHQTNTAINIVADTAGRDRHRHRRSTAATPPMGKP